MDLSKLSNKELEELLYNYSFYFERKEFCDIIRKELPKRYIYRILNKLYRKINAWQGIDNMI